MNKTKTLLLLWVMIAANFIYVNAQKIDEGKVVYEISYQDSDIPDEQMAMMPTEMTEYFKGNNARVEMKMGMGMSQVMIFDNKEKTMTMLMDFMGSKSAVKYGEADLKKQKEKRGKEDYQAKLMDETKDIAGYKCKKAVMTGKEGSFDLYYTDEISYKTGDWASDYKGVDGFPMQFKMNEGNVSMQMTAKKVEKEKVDDAMFSIPSDYKSMTPEEMQKTYGGK